MPPRVQVNWTCERKSTRRQDNDTGCIRRSQGTLLDGDDSAGEDVKMLEPIECTREAWLQRLAELPPEAEIALEVSTSGYFVRSVLEEAGWGERAHWVHTAGIDSLRKQKSDRLDTRRLVKKLAVQEVEPLPEAWFPPPPIRALRLLARQRCSMARLRAQTKNRVNSLLEMHGLRPQRCVFTVKGRAWIRSKGSPRRRSYASSACFACTIFSPPSGKEARRN